MSTTGKVRSENRRLSGAVLWRLCRRRDFACAARAALFDALNLARRTIITIGAATGGAGCGPTHASIPHGGRSQPIQPCHSEGACQLRQRMPASKHACPTMPAFCVHAVQGPFLFLPFAAAQLKPPAVVALTVVHHASCPGRCHLWVRMHDYTAPPPSNHPQQVLNKPTIEMAVIYFGTTGWHHTAPRPRSARAPCKGSACSQWHTQLLAWRVIFNACLLMPAYLLSLLAMTRTGP